jgi:ArsR family transcriptional regulator
MNPVTFYKCLADKTRLMCLLLMETKGELCVCDLTLALQVSQPKISRHLANLRNCGIVTSRKQDQWVYYKISPELDNWEKQVIATTHQANSAFIQGCLQHLEQGRNCC